MIYCFGHVFRLRWRRYWDRPAPNRHARSTGVRGSWIPNWIQSNQFPMFRPIISNCSEIFIFLTIISFNCNCTEISFSVNCKYVVLLLFLSNVIQGDWLVTLPLFSRKSKTQFVVEYCDWSHFKDNSLVVIVLEFHWSTEIIS